MTTEEKRPGCVLVSVQLPDTTDEDHEASLVELARLCDTLGYRVVARVTQKRASLHPKAVLGEGKLVELAALTGGTGLVPTMATKKKEKSAWKQARLEAEEAEEDAHKPTAEPIATVVVVDNEISPSQVRNLEKATGATVLDRPFVIIEIFNRHARTREAKLQVEIARLQYEAPRLREKEGTGDRQRGGGVGGKGDEQIELDRRRIRDRIAELRHELENMKHGDDARRARRKEALTVALVGYTNAGKSSLMRALTGSEVYVADKLFATLGTTVRALHPETRPRILVSDTVGFIKNLPHSLVASFRSTLDEAHEASLLLFVVDASDPAFRSQLQVTREVLGEIGAADIPSRIVLNKIDRVDETERKLLSAEFRGAIQTAAVVPEEVAKLRGEIVEFFEQDMVDRTVLVPYPKGALLAEIREHARVVDETFDEEGARLRVRAPAEAIERIEKLLAS